MSRYLPTLAAELTGYTVGPTLGPTEQPWDGWESDPRIDDGHLHEWESVLLQGDGRHRLRTEEVVRCNVCHAPRCGYSTDRDPCMERRHHRGDHESLSGKRWPLGGQRDAPGEPE